MDACQALTQDQRERIRAALLARRPDEVKGFLEELGNSVTRQIKYVRVTPLHGAVCECSSLGDAIEFIETYDEGNPPPSHLVRYEVELRYGNNDRITGEFAEKADALAFLRGYLPTLAEPDVEGAVHESPR